MLESVGKISQYLGLPINSSSHGHMIDIMMGWVHWLMLVLFVGWGIYLIITVFKFRSSSNPKADYNGVQSHYSQYAEYGVIIFEAFLNVLFNMLLCQFLYIFLLSRSDSFKTNLLLCSVMIYGIL